MRYGPREPSFAMHVGAKATGRKKFVDVGANLFEESSIAPQLRRSFCHQDARQTLGFLAGAAIKLPQHMCWAKKPMLMRCIQLDRLLSLRLKGQRFCADQRHVVKMHNVV